jgi:uncharacterized membrane protein YphA (DoxX/SURF4 family)
VYRFPHRLLLAFRIVLALFWLYEGLWLKIVHPSTRELGAIAAIGAPAPLTPPDVLRLIGVGEILLAFGVVTGRFAQALAILQFAVLVCANLIGLEFGQSAADPVGTLVRNLPLALCIYVVGEYSRAAGDIRVRARKTAHVVPAPPPR